MSCRRYRRLTHPLTSYQVAERVLLRQVESKLPKSWFCSKRTLGRIANVQAILATRTMDADLKIAVYGKVFG